MYTLPQTVKEALQKALQGREQNSLYRDAVAIHEKYTHSEARNTQIETASEALAYALYRMPATFGAVSYLIDRMRERVPDFAPSSLLDIGCGPGTAYFACREKFASLTKALCIDRNELMLDIFRTLVGTNSPEIVCRATLPNTNAYDLSILSYVLGEMSSDQQDMMLGDVYACSSTIFIVEPGTPLGFQTIMRARNSAIHHGFYIFAPCPHEKQCPHTSWCHVRARIERPQFLKLVKGGTLGYEDEALCYLILRKKCANGCHIGPYSRVVETPMLRSGHVYVTLCRPDGVLERTLVRKRDKDLYKAAKKLEWGSATDFFENLS